MKIEDLDNSKKKNKLSEAVKGTWRPGVFFKPKISKPLISKSRISKPKITDIETNWDFKPVPIATPPLIPGTGTPPAVTIPSLAHKPVEFPKLASVTDTVPDWKPSNFPDPVYDPGVVGGKLPEPDWSDRPEPEIERPELGGSKWGAKGQGIGTGPTFPPLPPPWKDREPHAYPVPFAKDPVFKKPELEPKITRDEPLPVPKDLPEPAGKWSGPPYKEPRYVDDTAKLHPPEGLDKDPSEEPLGGEKPHPIKYAELSDKEKKVFWRVLKGVDNPTAEQLEVHPNEWKEIILKTKADGDQITKFGFDQTDSSIQDSSTLAPANPEKGITARDFWEGLGYSSLAQFEKAQKEGGGGKIGYAKGNTTGKQVPVVYPKQAYISKQAIDAGLTIGPKGELVTTQKAVQVGKGEKIKKSEPFSLDGLKFAKDSSVLQQKPGEVAGGTPITQTVMPSLSAITREQMHKQLMGVLTGDKETKEQRAIIKDIEVKLKDLTPKDKIAITNHMTGIIERNIDPHDPDLYHIGGVDITGKELAVYAGAGVVGAAALAFLLPEAALMAALGSTATAARLTIPLLIRAMNVLKNSGIYKFAPVP
jgi:hypothetical protein